MKEKNNKKKIMEKPKTDLLTTSELSEALGVRYSTIKFYSQLGILPFQQKEKGLRRYYEKEEAQKCFKEIDKLKAKRLTIPEIIKQIKSK